MAEAERRIAPVWLERARTVLYSLALDGHPARAAASRARRALERQSRAEGIPALREALGEVLANAPPTWATPIRGPLDPKHANRAEFVRVLAASRRPEDPAFPGPTDWAYFDAGTGWTGAPRGFGGGWKALVATWGTELRKAGVTAPRDRKRAGRGS